jgi:hypothetical protein
MPRPKAGILKLKAQADKKAEYPATKTKFPSEKEAA